MAQLAAAGLPALQEAVHNLQLMINWSRTSQLAYTMLHIATTQLRWPEPSLPENWQWLLTGYAKDLLRLDHETRTWLALARLEDEAMMRHYLSLIHANVDRYHSALDVGLKLVVSVRDAKEEQERHEHQSINTFTEGGAVRSSNGEVEADPQQQGQDVEGEGVAAA